MNNRTRLTVLDIFQSKELNKPEGGIRLGAGMPLGYKTAKTLKKNELRARLRHIVQASVEALVQAQLDNAVGVVHHLVRDPAGKFVRITNEEHILAARNRHDEGSYVRVYTRDPSVQAFSDLMNRTIGPPLKQVAVREARDFSELSDADVHARLETLMRRLAQVTAKP